MSTQAKIKGFKIAIFNIKIAPKPENIDLTKFYGDLVHKIYAQELACKTRGDKFMEFKTMLQAEDKRIIYGNLIYYTVLSSKDWYNKDTKTIEQVDINSSLNPNAKEGVYYFIPEAHRFCLVLKNNGIQPSQVEIFLKSALERVVEEGQSVFVTQEVTEDFIERILRAERISKLEIDISYTNNDLTNEFDKLLDEDLKDGEVKSLELNAKSFKKQSLNLEKSKVLKGALMLSKSNGCATATIKETNNPKNITISTTEYPRIEQIATPIGEEHIAVLEKIMNLFRNNGTHTTT